MTLKFSRNTKVTRALIGRSPVNPAVDNDFQIDSITFFNTFRKDGECCKQRSQPPSKCQGNESKNPIILVNQNFQSKTFSAHQFLEKEKKSKWR